MKRYGHILLAVASGAAFCASAAASDDYHVQLKELENYIFQNPLTRNGYWFEMKNVAGEWEKIMLIFGYAGDGDLAACNRIVALAGPENPHRAFRCNPVH